MIPNRRPPSLPQVVEAANATSISCQINHTNQTQISAPSFDSRIYMLFLLPAFTLLVFTPNLKYLAPLSLVANVVMTASLALIYYYSITVRGTDTISRLPSLCLGVAMATEAVFQQRQHF